MTTDPLSSPVEPGEATNPASLAREELLKRERQRRMALMAQRKPAAARPPMSREHQSSTAGTAAPPFRSAHDAQKQRMPNPPELPAGYESHAQWQQALKVARAVAAAARAAGHPQEALGPTVQDMPAEELAQAVVRAVVPLPATAAVTLLLQSNDVGLAVLPPGQAARTRALITQRPGEDHTASAPGAPAADEAWRLYEAYERIQHARVGVDDQRRLLNYLPMPVVDDLIDARRVSARAVPESGERRLYLQARLAPAEIDYEGLAALGWREEQVRRNFRARLTTGDLPAADDIPALKGEQRRLVAQLEEVRRTGRISPELTNKKWLWPALERLAPNVRVDLRRDKAYGPWLVVRRIYRTIQAAHQARLRGDDKRYQTMLRAASNNATALQDSWTLAGWEARNALAYLHVLRSSDESRYDDALAMLGEAPGQAIKEDQLSQEARHHLATNRGVLSALKNQRDRTHVLNPYLVLGVQDESPAWKDRWRKLRSSLDEDGEAQVNEAKDAIQAWERERALIPPFMVPLAPGKWANPRASNTATDKVDSPMPRQTKSPTADERDFARMRAAHAIVRAACQHVDLPDDIVAAELALQRAVVNEQ